MRALTTAEALYKDVSFFVKRNFSQHKCTSEISSGRNAVLIFNDMWLISEEKEVIRFIKNVDKILSLTKVREY